MNGMRPPLTLSQRLGWGTAVAVGSLVLVFLVAPILAIVPLSFSSGTFLTYPLPGYSWQWYEEMLTSDKWLPALRNSLIVGGSATVLATVLGTLAALGLKRAPIPGKPVVMGLLLSPMIVPSVITAVAVYFFFAPVGLTNNFAGLILSHTVLGAPFVVVTVSATLEHFDLNLTRAAASLGASPFEALRRVDLPIIAPGVGPWLFASPPSFRRGVVPQISPAPASVPCRARCHRIRESMNPTITAIATEQISSRADAVCLEALRRRSERMTTGATVDARRPLFGSPSRFPPAHTIFQESRAISASSHPESWNPHMISIPCATRPAH
jgi:putative spermidine/putrescine transport system permease protein